MPLQIEVRSSPARISLSHVGDVDIHFPPALAGVPQRRSRRHRTPRGAHRGDPGLGAAPYCSSRYDRTLVVAPQVVVRPMTVTASTTHAVSIRVAPRRSMASRPRCAHSRAAHLLEVRHDHPDLRPSRSDDCRAVNRASAHASRSGRGVPPTSGGRQSGRGPHSVATAHSNGHFATSNVHAAEGRVRTSIVVDHPVVRAEPIVSSVLQCRSATAREIGGRELH